MATKTTKRALIVSVLSLFICFTMLLGTTYAWFTDSVTSAGNIIKTGTLDVSLEYSKTAPTTGKDDGKWIDASTGAIFDYSNWEPGYVQVRYVKIENEGSLALKFILNIIPNAETAAGAVDLADVIEVYMIDGTVETIDRDALTTDSAAYKGTLASLMAEDDGAAHGELVKGEFEIYTIALKMSESAGNEYQDKSVGGGFTVQLLATQLASENDDLGTNDYDTDATYPTVAKVNIPAGTTVPTPIKAGKTTVKIPAGVDAGEYEVSVSNENLETDENDNVTASFDIEVTKDGEKVGNGDYVVEKFIGENLNLTEVTHKGEVVNGAVYDPATGIVTFTVNSFSPFAITYYSGVIENVEDLANIAKGGNFVLAADVELAGTTLVIPENKVVNLDLNGKTITGTKGRDADNNRIHVIVNNGILTIKDGTVKSAGNDGGSAIYNNAGATLTIEDVTLYGAPQSDPVYETGVSKPFPSYAVNNYGNAVVNGATVKSYHGAIATGGNGVTVINDADIDVGLGQSTGITSYAIYSYENAQVTVNDGTFAFTKQEIYVNGGNTFCELGNNPIIINGGNYTGTSFSTGEGREYVIKGGTFDADPSAYVVEGYKAADNGDGTYTVIFPQESFDSLLDNAVAGDTVELPAGTYTFPAGKLEEGVTINCAPGTVFDGSSSLNINGATVVGGTFSNDSGSAASGTINGTFKNCSFTGSNALRWCYAGENVVFENCVFSGDVYGVHFDGGANEVIFKNCTFSGFNTFGGAITKLVLDGCTFKANDTSGYNGVNLWGSAELIDCTFVFDGKAGTEWVDACGDNKTYSFTNCVVTDGETEKGIETVVGNYGAGNTITIDGVNLATNNDMLTAAVANGATKVMLANGEYALRFTNNTNFNLNNMTIKGIGEVKLSITSTEAWYGRVQGSNVTFENIHFTSTVGATGMATYNNCTFDSWTICASSNNEKTYFNDCTINGCLNTSTDFSSGDVFVKNCKIAKAEYSGSMTVNFTECEIGEVIIWNANTNFTKCDVTTMNLDNVTTATITVDGVAK